MLNTAHYDSPADADALADWPGWLEADGLLSPGLRESYRRSLEGFEQFCRKRAQVQATSGTPAAVARVTVELAREYMELQRLERAPGPAQLQEWKDALNWLFRCRRDQQRSVLTGVPPLGRADLGQTPWERRLVTTLRVRHLSWRTEQTYRGWAWRLARFLGERPVESANEQDVRDFLSHLATTERVGAAAQKQALNALVFLLREAEGKPLGDFGEFTRARRHLRGAGGLEPGGVRAALRRHGGRAQAHGRTGLRQRPAPDRTRRSHPMCCGIRLRRICWSTARTSGRCRNCWAMRMWRPRRSIPTSCASRAWVSKARSIASSPNAVPDLSSTNPADT